ncbi:MAG: hypothetical protein C4K58_05800 [Flavobacteriaceae bacterium]|nr:MAG: hypothetical protein C4K58_05800 [Flavobacteriaceae bacterium]
MNQISTTSILGFFRISLFGLLLFSSSFVRAKSPLPILEKTEIPSGIEKNDAVLANPVISTQPMGGEICNGSSHTLSVGVTGTGVWYQWYKDGIAIAGATKSTYTTKETGKYLVKVYYGGFLGLFATEMVSQTAEVRLGESAKIVSFPTSLQICTSGTSTPLTVVATGKDLKYRWFKDGVLIPQAVSNSYTPQTAGNYSVSIGASCGTEVTASAQVTENCDTKIVAQPQNTYLCAGQTATLSVQATGNNLKYQWYSDTNKLIVGENSSSYTTNTPGKYIVTVNDGTKTITSNVADVTLNSGVQITSQPVSSILVSGKTSIGVQANGSNLKYQWLKEGLEIPGATSNVFTATSTGNYSVKVSGDCGSVTSDVAMVSNTIVISKQPVGGKVCELNQFGKNHYLNIEVIGNYNGIKWFRDQTEIPDSNQKAINTNLPGTYYAKVYFGGFLGLFQSEIISEKAVVEKNIGTTITKQPVSIEMCDLDSEFKVETQGSNVTYQWYEVIIIDWPYSETNVLIPGATKSTYKPTKTGTYFVEVKGDCNLNSFNRSNRVKAVFGRIPSVEKKITGAQPDGIFYTNFKIYVPQIAQAVDNWSSYNYKSQWYFNDEPILGATQHDYTPLNEGRYKVVTTGECGISTTSEEVFVQKYKVKIITQPKSSFNCDGSPETLTVEAKGYSLWYQWLYKPRVDATFEFIDRSNYNGSEPNKYVATKPGFYSVLVYAGLEGGIVQSDVVEVGIKPTLDYSQTPKVILSESEGILGYEYTPITNGPISSFKMIPDLSSKGVILDPIKGTLTYQKEAVGEPFVIEATNSCGQIVYNNPNCEKPEITSQPQSTFFMGDSETCLFYNQSFKVAAKNASAFQWYKGDKLIPGATKSEYEISEPGSYSVKVIGTCGQVISSQVVNAEAFKEEVVDIRYDFDNPTTLTQSLATFKPITDQQYYFYGEGNIYSNNFWGKYIDVEGASLKADGTITLDLTKTTIAKFKNTPFNIYILGGCPLRVGFRNICQPIKVKNELIRDTKLCGDEIANLKVDATGVDNYQWLRGDEIIFGANTSSFSTNVPGLYTVLMTTLCGEEERVEFKVIGERPKLDYSFPYAVKDGYIRLISFGPKNDIPQSEKEYYNDVKYHFSETPTGWFIDPDTGKITIVDRNNVIADKCFDIIRTSSCGTVEKVSYRNVGFENEQTNYNICEDNGYVELKCKVVGSLDEYNQKFNQINWYKDDVLIPGATGNVFKAYESGKYTVKVKDFCGQTTTSREYKVYHYKDLRINYNLENPSFEYDQYAVFYPEISGVNTDVKEFSQYYDTNFLEYYKDSFKTTILDSDKVYFKDGKIYLDITKMSIEELKNKRFEITFKGPCGNIAKFNNNGSEIRITKQPVDGVVCNNEVTFKVEAQGAVGYQWFYFGKPISGETSSTLHVSVKPEPAYSSYYVECYSSFGEVVRSNSVGKNFPVFLETFSYRESYSSDPDVKLLEVDGYVGPGITFRFSDTPNGWNIDENTGNITVRGKSNFIPDRCFDVIATNACGAGEGICEFNKTSIEISHSRNLELCEGEDVTLYAHLPRNVNSYQWYRDGVAIQGATSDEYKTKIPGKYKVEGIGMCDSAFSVEETITIWGNPSLEYSFNPTTSSTNLVTYKPISEIQPNAWFEIKPETLGVTVDYRTGIISIDLTKSKPMSAESPWYVFSGALCGYPRFHPSKSPMIIEAEGVRDCYNNNVKFKVNVIGEGKITYKWYKNGQLVYDEAKDWIGSFDQNLFLSNDSPMPEFKLVVSNAYGSVSKIIVPTPCPLTQSGTKSTTLSATFTTTVAPNPFDASTKLFVSSPDLDTDVLVNIYDFAGNLMLSSKLDLKVSSQLEFGDNFPVGVYIVNITQGEETKQLQVIKK